MSSDSYCESFPDGFPSSMRHLTEINAWCVTGDYVYPNLYPIPCDSYNMFWIVKGRIRSDMEGVLKASEIYQTFTEKIS